MYFQLSFRPTDLNMERVQQKLCTVTFYKVANVPIKMNGNTVKLIAVQEQSQFRTRSAQMPGADAKEQMSGPLADAPSCKLAQALNCRHPARLPTQTTAWVKHGQWVQRTLRQANESLLEEVIFQGFLFVQSLALFMVLGAILEDNFESTYNDTCLCMSD